MARIRGRSAAAVLAIAQLVWAGPASADETAAAVEKLSSRLASERREAVEELGRIKDPRFIGHLIGMLKDEEPMVRLEASGALMDIGPAVADPLLVAVRTETSPVFLWNAIRIFETLGDPKAIGPLIKIAETSPDPNIVQAARYTIERLERIKAEQAFPN